jgi:uncharacterized protein YoxC
MEQVDLNLSQTQLNKLLKGDTVQLKNSDIGQGHPISLATMNVRRLVKADNSGSGMRLTLTNAEIKANSMNGSGFNMKSVKKFGNKVGKNVKKGTEMGEKITKQVDVGMRKTANTLNKVNDVMDEFGYLEYVPVVGEAYGAVHDAVGATADGATQARKVTKQVAKAARDVNDFAQAPSWEKAQNFATKYAPTEEQVNEMNGSGVGDQMFEALTKRMNGSGMNTGNRRYGAGSTFIGSIGRGPAITGGKLGRGMRTGAGVSRSGDRYKSHLLDNELKMDHGTFTGALDTESYSESQNGHGKCKHCGR